MTHRDLASKFLEKILQNGQLEQILAKPNVTKQHGVIKRDFVNSIENGQWKFGSKIHKNIIGELTQLLIQDKTYSSLDTIEDFSPKVKDITHRLENILPRVVYLYAIETQPDRHESDIYFDMFGSDSHKKPSVSSKTTLVPSKIMLNNACILESTIDEAKQLWKECNLSHTFVDSATTTTTTTTNS